MLRLQLLMLIGILLFPAPLFAGVFSFTTGEVYLPQRLSDLVNGGAPVLLDYGHRLSVEGRGHLADGSGELSLEIHEFSDCAGAWGFFSLQLPTNVRPRRLDDGRYAVVEPGLVRLLSGRRVLFVRSGRGEEPPAPECLNWPTRDAASMPPICQGLTRENPESFPLYLASPLHLENSLPWLGSLPAVLSGFREGGLIRWREGSQEITVGHLRYRVPRIGRLFQIGRQLRSAGFQPQSGGWRRGGWWMEAKGKETSLRFRLIHTR